MPYCGKRQEIPNISHCMVHMPLPGMVLTEGTISEEKIIQWNKIRNVPCMIGNKVP